MTTPLRTLTIDGLRGLGAVMVVIFHINEGPLNPADTYHNVVKLGWLGVPVFFVVSGFCISNATNTCAGLAFFARRFLRIYPPYWVSLLVVLAVVAVRVFQIGTNDVTALPHDLKSVLYTALAFVGDVSGVTSMNWVYWSLGYELAFYLHFGAHTAQKPILDCHRCIAPGSRRSRISFGSMESFRGRRRDQLAGK
ncbi:acyltransferase family protein [Synoicihabitans lomoniglobus]|uniref:Acyltransferase n=1 Tax=Synoicihabitans lomoniglobus TaxID=2909285 RepID=A0AAE9ZX62_9BACT|nr:acyltransferase [Opitutaceae bacterium LMO-M01]WED64163.1 acyltransferase [Opitutaceae bacterium LMO-M01]